ncbi:hypothetical protein B5G52_03270 [Pseudoalteromonas sp. A601]|uniref:hypothetical protein n=1 Tax=Pseudoalteromonas sp. A601 TaxID=1967839 RepID=UPI000B3C389B|nr:hypothetical protein [Pseudoalteromonas sp. A601]OUS73797.1 hypothetical protein B5G52_03270 [Pseudoalteromonas sp. A601]
MSKSKIIYINKFYPTELHVDFSSKEKGYQVLKELSGYLPKFPIIVQSNSLPWRIGNLYLVRLVLDYKGPQYNPETHKQKAIALVEYLRFLESENLHYAQFPVQKRRRPTYRFRNYLLDLVSKNEMAISTAQSRINQVISFYKTVVEWGLLEKSLIKDGLAFEQIEKTISYINNTGFSKSLAITSTDLAISSNNAPSDPDAIMDEGRLKPLTPSQQIILLDTLKGFSRGIELFFLVALYTGARLQTIGTLRIRHLKNVLRWEDGYAIIPYGGSYDLDGKKGRLGQLWVPKSLLDDLLTYANSQAAIDRRKSSFYGESDDNYLFLTRNGTPYYTSRKETNERRDADADYRVDGEHAIEDESLKKGEAIGVLIRQEILPKIRITHPHFPSFSIHDLRATYGMNLLEACYRLIDRENFIRKEKKQPLIGYSNAVDVVQIRLNHKSRSVTERYLKYRDRSKWKAKLISEFESRLIGEMSIEVEDETSASTCLIINREVASA